MVTRLLYDAASIRAEASKVVSTITSGGIVAVPTLRWYMICCDAGNQELCNTLFLAKRRSPSKPLLFVTSGIVEARGLFQLGSSAEALIKNLWPGEVALLLRWAQPELGQIYSAVGRDIALVMQPPGFLGEVAAACPTKIAATSANISGQPGDALAGPAISADEVEQFIKQSGLPLALLIDGGICPFFTHTTIVDCSDPHGSAKVVREGIVHTRSIARALADGA